MDVIRSIVGSAAKLPRGYSQIGDDVALVPPGTGKLVVKVDMLVEHTDVPRTMTYRQAARKSVAMCVSDFAAKGVSPDSFMVSLGLKKGVTCREGVAVARGFRDAGCYWGVHLVGGDTNEAKELVIDCAMVGFAQRVVARSGAEAGDSLVATGTFGCPPAGLAILRGSAAADSRFMRKATSSVLMPTPNLKVGMALAPFLSSAMDSSDGLARSLHTLARESGVGFDLTSLPAGEGVNEFAKANGIDAEKLVLEGGEEYVIVGTVKPSRMAGAKVAARRAGGRLLEIGRARPAAGRVRLCTRGATKSVRDSGWTHLG